jgi:hypothetical protein
MAQRSGTEIYCENPSCRRLFYVEPWELRRHTRYCSRICANIAKRGRKLSDETKKRLSNALKGTKNPFFGKRHTDETKRKISEKKKGTPAWNKGIPSSNETKKKLSIAHSTPFHISLALRNLPKIRIYTSERRNKMRIAMTGRKHTEESIELMRTYTMNQSAFNLITEESAYWLGFFMADGSISEIKTHANGGTTPYVVLKLQIRDLEHLKKFKTFMTSTHPISIYTDKRGKVSCRLGFSAKKLALKLSEYGITARKSLCGMAKCGLECNKDFWRGVIDGDGTLSHGGYPRLYLVGSYNLLIQFKVFVEKIVGQTIISRLLQRKSIYRLTLCGQIALKVVKILYDSCSVALERKLERAKLMLSKLDKPQC